MTVTTTAVAALPSQVMLESGAALNLSEVVAEFLAADEASRAALEAARLQNSVAADDEAERLYGEAEDAWMRVASGWAANSFVPEGVLVLGREYEAARAQVSMPARAAAGDWRESVAAVDWFRSRPAVTR